MRSELIAQFNSTNERSWLYGYDGLSRLTDATQGVLDLTSTPLIVPTQSVPGRAQEWTLDILGNWVGDGGQNPGLADYRDPAGAGTFPDWTLTDHAASEASSAPRLKLNDRRTWYPLSCLGARANDCWHPITPSA